MAQVAGEEGHLVRAAQHDALRARDQVDGGGHLVAVDLAGGLGHVRVVGGEGGLELGLVDREERLGGEVGWSAAPFSRARLYSSRAAA